MDSPRVIRPDSRVSVPKLGLKHLPAGVVKAASILTAVSRLTAQFCAGACSMGNGLSCLLARVLCR